MATVPISPGQTVEARPAPFVPQNTQFDPSAFGAGIGQAEQGLGQMVGKDAEEGAKIATNMQIQNDVRAAKVADTQHQKAVTDAGFTSLPGGPDGNKGYFSLQGQDAVTYRPTYQKALEDSSAAISDSLKDSPRAQNLYNNQAGMRVQGEVQRSAMYANSQGLVADNNASAARLSAYKDSLTVNYNDPAALANFQQVTRGEVADTARRMGWGTDQTAEATTKALSAGYRDAILARVSSGDIAGAGAMFHQLAPGMDAATSVGLAQHLQPLMTGAAADTLVKSLMGGGNGTPTTAPASDPGLPRGIRNNNPGNLNFANQDGAMLENHDNPRFAAFPTMQAGVDALGKQLQLDNSRGYDTISKLLAKYAPPSENNTQGYISAVAQSTGFGPNDKLDTSNPATLKALQKAIISHENGGQYGVLAEGGGVPAGNATDANPAIHPDFAGMQQKLLDATAGDPKLQAAALARLHTAANEYTLSTQADRDKIHSTWDDTVAAATAGNDKVSIDEAMIRHVYRPDVADYMVNKFNEAVQVGQLNGSLKLATPDQANAVLTHLAADQKDEDPAHFVQRQKALNQAQTFMAQRAKALNDDPATYVMQDPNVAAAYKAVDPQKPETVQAAADASMSSQRTLGVENPRVLGTAQAAAMVKSFESSPIETTDVGAKLDKLQQTYGPHYGDVTADLKKAGLSPEYQMLAHANLPEQLTVREDLQRALQDKAALKTDKDKFGATIPADQKRLLDPAIDSALAPFRQTTMPYSSTETFDSVVQPAVKTLATYYAAKGYAAQDAVDKAATLITKSYDFDGMLRTPKGMMGQVQAAAHYTQNTLTDADLRGTTGAEAQRDGVWVTSADDKGAVLYKGTTQGGYMPIRRADGSPVGFTFAKMPTPGPAAPESGQAAVMNVGLN